MADLDLERVRSLVGDTVVGRTLHYFPSVDSTNRVAADIPAGESLNGTVILADFQERGRGRAGRSWVAPPDTSVMLSVVFVPEPGVARNDYIMMMALAARAAIVDATGLDVALKWPNDLLVRGRKVAGILGESSSREGHERIILGVGINISFGAARSGLLPPEATSLDLETGRGISREVVAGGLIRSLNLWYRSLTHRPDDIFDAWAAALDTVGLPVSVHDAGTTWNGIARGVQRDGGLLVETDEGRIRPVYASDVSIRHPRFFTAS